MKDMNQDNRHPVAVLWGEGDAEDGYHAVGQWKNCDDIAPYYEAGQMAAVPWFAVTRNGTVIARVNAAKVRSVLYAP